MHFNLNFNLDKKIYRIQDVSLPCFANISKNSIGFFFSEKIGFKASLNAFGILKFLILFVPLIFGVSQAFGQKGAIPDINASVSGAITCINTTVELKGSSKTPGVYYTWAGLGYFTTAQNGVTSMPGDYTLTVTDPATGSIATAKVKVLVDTVSPAEVKANVSGMLTCIDTLVTLAASSSTSGVTFDWNGPKGFTSTIKRPVTANSGVYLVKVVNPANGCTARASVAVNKNIAPPSGVSATVSGILTCKDTSVTLTGTSATKGVRYDWSGPGFTSSISNPKVSASGAYALKITDPANGCFSKAKVIVEQLKALPERVTVVSDTITCKKAKATLAVSTVTKGVIYSWLGPNAFTSSEPTLETSDVGNFKVTVFNPENGCSVTKSVMVVRDTITPAGLTAVASGILSCKDKSVALKGTSSSPKVTFAWSGPANFTSAQPTPLVTKPGSYSLIATNTKNGCISKASVIVTGVPCENK